MKEMATKRKPAIRGSKVIHICIQEKNIKDIQMLLVGNHEPQNGVVYKMLGAIKDINEINEKLTGIGGIVKELHEESLGKREVVKTDKENKAEKRSERLKWIQTFMFIVGAIGLCLTAYFGFKNREGQDVIIKKQDTQSIPFVVNSRGETLKLPDSTRIIFFNNDSARYIIKKEK